MVLVFFGSHNPGQNCFPLCGNALNASSNHPFADTSSPQWEFSDPLWTNMLYCKCPWRSVNSSLAHRQAVYSLPGGYSTIPPHKWVHCSSSFLSDDHMCLTWSWHVRCTHVNDENHYTIGKPQYVTYNQSHTHSPFDCKFVSTNTCQQKLDYCALSLFGGIHITIVNCYFASVSVNNTAAIECIHIQCHLPEKSQSSTAGNDGAPTSVPLSLGYALYVR